MRIKGTGLLLSLLAGALFCMSGCAALVAGGAAAGGTYAYMSGWLERTYQAPLDEAYQASLGAAQELGMEVVEREQELGKASIQAERNDTTYWIELNSTDGDMTEIRVRAGLLGDEEASQRVHEAIQANL